MKLYLRLTSDATGEHGQVTLEDLRKLGVAANRQGAPKDSTVIGVTEDALHRFYQPAVEWTEDVER